MPRPPRTTTSILASGLTFVRHAADRGLGRAMARGAFECAELACAVRLVAAGDVVVDGGAHLGIYALHLAQRLGASGRVYAFEPHPETRALLEQAVAANGFSARLVVSSAALGDAPGAGVLRTSRRCGAYAHASLERAGAPASRAERLIPVDVVRLDVAAIEGRVALIKLDVEGAEFLAVRGGLGLIRRDRPAILCELGDEQLARVSGASSESLMAMLAAVGYSAHAIGPEGRAGPRLLSPPTTRVSTVLFLPARR
ncbi:MAG: FkbM family methyltransferase [Acidobacteriota bacterium]